MKLLKIFLVPVFACFLILLACHKSDNHANTQTSKSAINIQGSELIDFSFSANGHPDYAVGYGDVRVCSQVANSGSGSGNCF